jgi:predicted short-subunit dehydrogenase-like oxidoreductase (DUF2520 family)
MNKITLVGAGNLAWHLAESLESAGYAIAEVYSRELRNANLLAQRTYNATPTNHLDFKDSEADFFFICVPDNAIKEIVLEIQLPPNAILVHTSGAEPLATLSGKNVSIGVFYPLQTFTKGRKLDFGGIPICVESDEKNTVELLVQIAQSISKNVYEINSEERAVLHLAAVFACNFTNHLLTISKQIMEQQQLDFEMLQPLIKETIEKALRIGPENGQTGPAKRADSFTLIAHQSLLQKQFPADFLEVYEIISKNITNFYCH